MLNTNHETLGFPTTLPPLIKLKKISLPGQSYSNPLLLIFQNTGSKQGISFWELKLNKTYSNALVFWLCSITTMCANILAVHRGGTGHHLWPNY